LVEQGNRPRRERQDTVKGLTPAVDQLQQFTRPRRNH
jgi:hypothetical protein